MMIDSETRAEVVSLWKKGIPRSRIKELTGISLPSVRKIINASEQDQVETREDIYPVDTFIINNSRNWPYRSNPPLQCLRNGAPLWGIPNLLRPMYSEPVIRQIMREIAVYDPFQVFRVTVEHRDYGRAVVSVEMLDGLS